MRLKTEEKRRAILTAAAIVFQEEGYERASMAAIAARVGGSKTTLYAYFKSKEELFAAVMTDAMDAQADQVFELLTVEPSDLAVTFLRFSNAYIDVFTSPGTLAYIRVGIAEGASSGLGRLLYSLGQTNGLKQISAFIGRYMDAGLLRDADPFLAALHLKGIIEAGILEPSLYGAELQVDRERAVASGVDVFLRAYAAPPTGKNGGVVEAIGP